ncbi:hypothetical protein U1Q18_026585 [Sarracenia purpurea var. burkii]
MEFRRRFLDFPIIDQSRFERAFQLTLINSTIRSQNGFVKTKSKAMKIYVDLKKVKIYGDLNSIFTVGSVKKARISSPTKLKSAYVSTCSLSSSFSRSCLSKTPESIDPEIPIFGFEYCVGRFGFAGSLSDQSDTRPRPD